MAALRASSSVIFLSCQLSLGGRQAGLFSFVIVGFSGLGLAGRPREPPLPLSHWGGALLLPRPLLQSSGHRWCPSSTGGGRRLYVRFVVVVIVHRLLALSVPERAAPVASSSSASLSCRLSLGPVRNGSVRRCVRRARSHRLASPLGRRPLWPHPSSLRLSDNVRPLPVSPPEGGGHAGSSL